MVMPLPVTVAWFTVRLLPPELVSVTVLELLLPTLALPNETLVGLTFNCPGEVCTPLPLSEMLAGELSALWISETLPVTPPAALGANRTKNVVL